MAFLLAGLTALAILIRTIHDTPKFRVPETTELRQSAAAIPDEPIAYSVPFDLIDVDDLVSIAVAGDAEISHEYRVRADGTILFPLIGSIPAAGLSAAQLTDRLIERLKDGFFVDPQVRVSMDPARAPVVIVGGNVRVPGRVKMDRTMTLAQALTLAGSPTAAADDEVVITHAADGRTSIVNIKTQAATTVLQNGDSVFVPRVKTIYVFGEVRNPGAYVFDSGMTVAQAVALAGGLTPVGANRTVKIIRRLENGNRQTTTATPRDVIRPNDTIQVERRLF